MSNFRRGKERKEKKKIRKKREKGKEEGGVYKGKGIKSVKTQ